MAAVLEYLPGRRDPRSSSWPATRRATTTIRASSRATSSSPCATTRRAQQAAGRRDHRSSSIASGGVLPNIHAVLLPSKAKENEAESPSKKRRSRRRPRRRPLPRFSTDARRRSLLLSYSLSFARSLSFSPHASHATRAADEPSASLVTQPLVHDPSTYVAYACRRWLSAGAALPVRGTPEYDGHFHYEQQFGFGLSGSRYVSLSMSRARSHNWLAAALA
jgi:hypothetical protein